MSEGLRKHKTIAICVARTQEDYESNLVMSISKEAKRRGYKIFVFNSFSDLALDTPHTRGSAGIYKLINKKYIDAIVMLPESIKKDSVCDGVVAYANKNNIPIVSVEHELKDCINVDFDYQNAFEVLVRHVIEDHHCTKVNFIAGIEGNDFSELRVDCYKKVLAENGIPFDETRMGYGNFWAGPTREVMNKFLADERGLPEAIICCNDSMAMAASQMLQERGIRIPEDVIITGFDGIEAEKYATPRLTTAATDFEQLGTRVLDCLQSIMDDKPLEQIEKVGFMVRYAQSCGCKAINAYEAASKITELYERISYIHGHENFMYAYLSSSMGCQTYKSLAKTAARHAEKLNIWICLNRTYFANEHSNRVHELYDEDMVLFCHAKEDSLLDFCQPFKFEEYLPDFENVVDQYDLIFFCPINHQDKTYGYAVLAGDIGEIQSNNAQRYLMNTNQIFENVHKSVELNAAYAEMKEMHLRDALTGLYNRHGFNSKCVQLMEKAQKNDKKMVIFSVDLDNLKVINDMYGHAVGDVAICASADILSEYTQEDVVCSRFGGDEYVVVLMTDQVDTIEQEFMEYVQDKINEYKETKTPLFELSMSVGMDVVKKLTLDGIQDALKVADDKMYEQKRLHKRGRQ